MFCEYECCGSDSIESACSQCRRPGFDSWVGKIPGVGNGNPLQYSCLENSMDKAAWWAQFPGSQRVRNDWVTNTLTLMCATLILWGKNQIWKTVIKKKKGQQVVENMLSSWSLSDYFCLHKKTNITEFLGCARASLVAQMVKNLPAMWETWVQSLGWEDPLGRAWQPTPVFLPGESYGQRNLAGYSPWSRKESDVTEQLSTHMQVVPDTAKHWKFWNK